MRADRHPDGWQLVKLADLGEVNRGRSRHRPRYAAHLYGGPYPFVQTGDIKASGGRITTHQQTYSDAGLAQSRLWPTGTLCITIAANIAETAILTFPACFPDSVVGFIADKSKCDVYFVEYLFRHLKLQIQREATGSVQDNINLDTLNRLVFPVPPLEEQHAIAQILRTLDDQIALNRKMSETMESIARTLFKAWFVDFEPVRAKMEGRWKSGQSLPGLPAQLFPMFPDSFVQIGTEQVPTGWHTVALETLVERERGISYGIVQPGTPVSDGIPIIRVSDIRNGRINTQNPLRVSADVESGYARTRLRGGELLLTLVGTVGEAAVVPEDLFGWNTARAVAVVPVQKHIGAHWIRLALNSPMIRQVIDSRLNTTVQATLNLADVSKLPITVPPDDHRNSIRQFNDMLAPVFASLQLRDRESRTIAILRDLLLPKLISGEIRLKDAEHLVESVIR